MKVPTYLKKHISSQQEHCVKSVQIRSFFWSVFSPNAGKYGPEKTPYLDTFHAVYQSKTSAHKTCDWEIRKTLSV